MASCLLLLAALAILFVAAAAQDSKTIMEPSFPSCSTTDNYTDGSQYKKNLDQLLAALPAAAGDNGWFYKGSAGAGTDVVSGLIMCFADHNATQCLDCLTRAPAGITTVCPGSRNVGAAYDACVLRYSAAPIPAVAELNAVYRKNASTGGSGRPVVVNPDAVRAAWVPLLSKLTGGIASSPLRIFNSSTRYSGNKGAKEMYGLAQCSRDLNASECVSCISSFANLLVQRFDNNTGGAIKGYSCYLRYLHTR